MQHNTKPSFENSYSRYASALKGERLPAAFVDMDALRQNIACLQKRAGRMPVRLVTKSIRCRSILRRLVGQPPFLNGLMCYSAAEAAWLADDGFDNLLVAYPTVEEEDLIAVSRCLQDGRRIVLMVDCEIQIDLLARLSHTTGAEFPVAIDLDMSSDFPGLHFGVHRSPVSHADQLVKLAQIIGKTPGVRLVGLMGYEAQIAGLMDDVPGQALKNIIVRYLKRRSVREINARRAASVAALKRLEIDLDFVNGGGSGSFETTGCDDSVTEFAAGSALFAPALFDHYRTFSLEPAAGFVIRVVRQPKPGIFTCLGGGYSASGPAGRDRMPSIWLPEGAALLKNEGAGEVQTPVSYFGVEPLGIGSPVFFRHAKAGELCERFNELLLIENGTIVERAPTYRGEGKCFL